MQFVYEAAPAYVVFGAGTRAKSADTLARLGIARPLLLSTPPKEDLARNFAETYLGGVAGLYANATMHTPVEVTADAMNTVEMVAADGLVALGGGSTIGLAKAIALRTGLPQLAIPTTYAGSEMTPILGQTENGIKTTLKDTGVRPAAVIYDPDLTMTLPPAIAGPSGMNAIAHAVEALYAEDTNPVISLMAEEAIRALGAALPMVMEVPENRDARAEALYGAWLAGTCLGAVGMAVHHKICHTLGGSFGLPHADVHCLMIAYSAKFNADHAPDAMARVARALRASSGPGGLYDLLQRVGAHKSLAALGMTEPDLDKAADLAVQKPYFNPRPVDRDGVRQMLEGAFRGSPP